MKIIFVCTGNTCRSPMAEGFMKCIASAGGNSDIQVYSRGLAVSDGLPASEFSIKAAQNFGADISSHISRQLTSDDVADADLIVTMMPSHANAIKSALPMYANKVYAISEYVDSPDVLDPYGSDQDTYILCAKMLHMAVNLIYNKITGTNL